MKYNEDSRVKIPSLLHLTRLGYTYLSLKGLSWDIKTNIFPKIFIESIARINGIDEDEASRVLAEVSLLLENNDLGKSFYERLVNSSEIKDIFIIKFILLYYN